MGFRIFPSSLFKMARCPSPEIKKSPNVLEKCLNSKLKRITFWPLFEINGPRYIVDRSRDNIVILHPF